MILQYYLSVLPRQKHLMGWTQKFKTSKPEVVDLIHGGVFLLVRFRFLSKYKNKLVEVLSMRSVSHFSSTARGSHWAT